MSDRDWCGNCRCNESGTRYMCNTCLINDSSEDANYDGRPSNFIPSISYINATYDAISLPARVGKELTLETTIREVMESRTLVIHDLRQANNKSLKSLRYLECRLKELKNEYGVRSSIDYISNRNVMRVTATYKRWTPAADDILYPIWTPSPLNYMIELNVSLFEDEAQFMNTVDKYIYKTKKFFDLPVYDNKEVTHMDYRTHDIFNTKMLTIKNNIENWAGRFGLYVAFEEKGDDRTYVHFSKETSRFGTFRMFIMHDRVMNETIAEICDYVINKVTQVYSIYENKEEPKMHPTLSSAMTFNWDKVFITPLAGCPEAKKVIISGPATTVIWADGTKTVVKAQNGEPMDKEKGLAMAIVKKVFGNKGKYYTKFRKMLDNAEVY